MDRGKLAWRLLQLVQYTLHTPHPLQGIVDGNPLQVLVATVFLLARCGLGFRVLQHGYVGADFPEPSGFSRHVS